MLFEEGVGWAQYCLKWVGDGGQGLFTGGGGGEAGGGGGGMLEYLLSVWVRRSRGTYANQLQRTLKQFTNWMAKGMLLGCYRKARDWIWGVNMRTGPGMRMWQSYDVGKGLTVYQRYRSRVKIRHKADAASALSPAPATFLIRRGRQEVSYKNSGCLQSLISPCWRETTPMWVMGRWRYI